MTVHNSMQLHALLEGPSVHPATGFNQKENRVPHISTTLLGCKGPIQELLIGRVKLATIVVVLVAFTTTPPKKIQERWHASDWLAVEKASK